MSCREGNCGEDWKRRNAIILFGLMLIGFIILSAFSFLDSRGQVTPDQISYNGFPADEGKRTFQSFNCMGCHTLVGNGAYFAPDLTKEYAHVGPAWLAAFLPSAGGWPTEAAIQVQLSKPEIAEDSGVSTIDEYYAKYPGAKERVQRRIGSTNMPNLPIDSDNVNRLIAYLKYVSAMNTEGWPAEIKIESLEKRIALAHHQLGLNESTFPSSFTSGSTASPSSSGETSEGNPSPAQLIKKGKDITQNLGCIACHTSDGSKSVGPSWKGLYGTQAELDGGGTALIDDAYIEESIRTPDAKVVKGYFKGTMPSYDKLVSGDDMTAIVAYIRSLEN